MYERFTDRSRKVMRLANAEAEASNCRYLQTEHILLGLIKEGDGVAAHVFESFGLNHESIQHEINRLAGTGELTDPSDDSMPLETFVELSMDEARLLDHHYVGTEHMLLALSRDPNSTAARVLANLDLVLAEIRAEVLDLLGHGLNG